MGVLEILPASSPLAILGTLAVVYLAHRFYVWYRLSHVPGPFWASISKFWMVREALKGRQPFSFHEVSKRYGMFLFSLSLSLSPFLSLSLSFSLSLSLSLSLSPFSFLLVSRVLMIMIIGSLARVGPNELITDDPELLRKMMAVRSPYTRGPCNIIPSLSISTRLAPSPH